MKTEEENNCIQKKIPDYFIFIKCPHIDYDISNSPKQSVLEFKDWGQINKLLDKLIQFFSGETYLKEENRVYEDQACNKAECSNTREQVKKIMEKIMRTHSKKPGISYMHNVIEGKQIKRKIKKLSKKPTAEGSNHKDNGESNNKTTNGMINIKNFNNSDKEEINVNKKTVPKDYSETNVTQSCLGTVIDKKYNSQFKKISKNNESNIRLKKNIVNKNISKNKKIRVHKDLILRKFEMNTLSIKKRFDKLERRTRQIVNQMHKKACNMIVNDNIVMDNNIPKKQVNISVRKQIDEIIIHNHSFNKPKTKFPNKYNACEDVKNKLVQSNYDLLQTVLKSQKENVQISSKNVADVLNNMAAIKSPPSIAKVTGIETTKKLVNMEPENNFTEPMITFKSHNYYAHQDYNAQDNSFHSHMNIQNKNVYNKRRTFITKQSRDNFVLPYDVRKRKNYKKINLKTGISKQFQSHIKKLFKQTSKLFTLRKKIMGNVGESSCTIEFAESNSCSLPTNQEAIMTNASRNSTMSKEETLPRSDNHVTGNNVHTFINTSTYVVPSVDGNGYSINVDDNWAFRATYTIEKTNDVIDNSDLQNRCNRIHDHSENNRNFIFVSKSQEREQNEEIVDAGDVCEIILYSEDMLDRESGRNSNYMPSNVSNKHIYATDYQGNYDDFLYNCFNSIENEALKERSQNIRAQYNINESSHHSTPNKNVTNEFNNANEIKNPSPILSTRESTGNGIHEKNTSKIVNNFKFINRPCFLPKGMSPIFQNCRTKNVCEYNLSRDYYEKEMYVNFADDVRINAEIFEPKIQIAKEITTKAIEKVNAKLTNDNSVLKFDGQSLKNAKILGQIDQKFIAATMKEGCSSASTDYLVLFDQHAVHERIRLENNLTEYFSENHWKPVKIDAVSIMLSRDDVMYLHNFKDKFEQLGLQWTSTSTTQVSVVAIPEAILGKNPRQVERVITAVKNLIAEEINIIKIQGGCVSLYPKSIMDLVFSEACRYAIKFGDKLSKSECVELLKTLAGCKTPFQCAHGRPVMTVLMETKLDRVNYKFNVDKLVEWKRKLQLI